MHISRILLILSALLLISAYTNRSTSTGSQSKKSSATGYNTYSEYVPPTFEPLPTLNFDPIEIPSFSFFTDPPKAAGIVFISYPETAGRNEHVSVKIKGDPYTEYDITVTYSSGPSSASGLYPKESNADGYVTWIWKIGGRTNLGTYPITVSGGGSTETVYFKVIS